LFEDHFKWEPVKGLLGTQWEQVSLFEKINGSLAVVGEVEVASILVQVVVVCLSGF